MSRDSANQYIPIGKISSLASEELTTSNRVSTAAGSNNEFYWLAARADTYIRRFADATAAAATDVTATGATVGQLIPSGAALPVSLDRGEVLKIDTAGDIVISRFY